jgi:Cof subfamily protein (haloacid dehalogenase superfamily)
MHDNEPQLNIPVFDVCPGAVAIDLDRTLFDSRTCLSPRNRRAIEMCLDQGIPVIIATSRPARAVRRFLGEELSDSCTLVLQNGAIAVASPPLSGTVKEPITAGLAGEIVDYIISLEPEIRITVEVDGYWFGTNLPRDPEELWEYNSATPDMQLPLQNALEDEPSKIAGGGLDRSILHVARALSGRYSDLISVIPADDDTFLNITSVNASKPASMRKLLASRNISLDSVVAFGDDTPDIGMLAACGISVAVGNAIPEVKAVAGYCTASNDDDGVAIVLEKMLEEIRNT